MSLIELQNVVKIFKQKKQGEGLKGTLSSFLKRNYVEKRAVNDVSFSIEQGEIVGYIGPNGAGKSTTIKMLSGILLPTSGEIIVDGIDPFKDREKNAKSIGVVFGQRTQLWLDLPIVETYNLIRHMYKIEKREYDETLKTIKELLSLDEIWSLPVRQLSLGQRMRGELGAALIHRPKILYLDEPTIGMDAIVTEKIRHFLVDINKKENTTILLTTHNLDEVERICKRVIIITDGKKLFDGSIEEMRAKCCHESQLIVDFEEIPTDTGFRNLNLKEIDGYKATFLFNRNKESAGKLIESIISEYSVKDIFIKDPSIDVVIKELYESDEVKTL